jgi:hypothetical protein
MNEAQAHMLIGIQETLEIIAAELERLRVLKEYELGVRLEYHPDAGPYVPEVSDE